jgi:hypothetical protein
VLLARVYEVLPLLCSGHRAKRGRGAEMRILAFLTDPPVVSAILLHLTRGGIGVKPQSHVCGVQGGRDVERQPPGADTMSASDKHDAAVQRSSRTPAS